MYLHLYIFLLAFLLIDVSLNGKGDIFARLWENKWNMFSVCLILFFGMLALWA